MSKQVFQYIISNLKEPFYCSIIVNSIPDVTQLTLVVRNADKYVIIRGRVFEFIKLLGYDSFTLEEIVLRKLHYYGLHTTSSRDLILS